MCNSFIYILEKYGMFQIQYIMIMFNVIIPTSSPDFIVKHSMAITHASPTDFLQWCTPIDYHRYSDIKKWHLSVTLDYSVDRKGRDCFGEFIPTRGNCDSTKGNL